MHARSVDECDELIEIRDPCTVVNTDEEIILWYIPDCLVRERLVTIVSLTNSLPFHYLICIKGSDIQFRKRSQKQLAETAEKKGRFQE